MPPASSTPSPSSRTAADGPGPVPPGAGLAPADLAAAAATLREDLAAAGFTVDGVERVLGPVASAALHREQAVPARRALRDRGREGADPTAALAALFLLGDDVPRRALDAALGRTGVDGARRLGLVEAAGAGDDDAVRALVDLRPYAATDAAGPVTWWLSSDLGELATGRRLAPDHVLGAGGASLTLAQVTVRTPVGRVLDLGTGCGIQALHAARHARAVVGTDISRRALGFAAFNAALDAAFDEASGPAAGAAPHGPATGRVELREGSMLEPVTGERFDLVVSNPPFVITPRAAGGALPDYEYRDGGRSGDDLVRDLVTGVGAVLEPGGVAQLLGNWEHRRGVPWDERVGAWLDEAGLDGWVVQREVLDPAEYAETWIRDGGTTPEREPAAWAAAYGAWLDDFAARDVEAVGFGIVTLRRPLAGARPTLRRLEEHTGSVRQPLGAHLAASLAAHDWLAARDDAALGGERLAVAPDVTEERFHTPGAPDPTVVLLRQGDGLGRAVRATTGLAALVGASDGELTVGQLVGAIAALFEVGAEDLAGELLPDVRGLVRDGFLVPVG
ncbi:SAM-dependent methyltransferase [Sphaerisporangium cinnabarinum]|nr:methyltransferase [Sphaerisporangium cinnabarinum]PTU55524.1 SAM-dependent methyltransferase [Sphaerisporangium cinnabarinum]